MIEQKKYWNNFILEWDKSVYNKETRGLSFKEKIATFLPLPINEKEWNVVSEITGINEPELLMRRKRLKAMAITRGKNGATLYSAAGGIEFKPSSIELVDQTGAGDAFSAVLAVGILVNAHPAQALAASCQAGAIVASKKGALVDLPKDILEAYEEELS